MTLSENEVVRFINWNSETKLKLREDLKTEKDEKKIEAIQETIKKLKKETAWIYKKYRKSLTSN